jgi:hypothetical protein
MRGADTFTESLFSMRHSDDFVPVSHLLRSIRNTVSRALVSMDALLGSNYEARIIGGCPRIAPRNCAGHAVANFLQPAL